MLKIPNEKIKEYVENWCREYNKSIYDFKEYMYKNVSNFNFQIKESRYKIFTGRELAADRRIVNFFCEMGKSLGGPFAAHSYGAYPPFDILDNEWSVNGNYFNRGFNGFDMFIDGSLRQGDIIIFFALKPLLIEKEWRLNEVNYLEVRDIFPIFPHTFQAEDDWVASNKYRYMYKNFDNYRECVEKNISYFQWISDLCDEESVTVKKYAEIFPEFYGLHKCIVKPIAETMYKELLKWGNDISSISYMLYVYKRKIDDFLSSTEGKEYIERNISLNIDENLYDEFLECSFDDFLPKTYSTYKKLGRFNFFAVTNCDLYSEYCKDRESFLLNNSDLLCKEPEILEHFERAAVYEKLLGEYKQIAEEYIREQREKDNVR